MMESGTFDTISFIYKENIKSDFLTKGDLKRYSKKEAFSEKDLAFFY